MHQSSALRSGSIQSLAAVLSVLIIAGAGCHSNAQPPSAPSQLDTNIGGTWSGTASDSTGPGQLTWRIVQDGTAFTGTLSMIDAGTHVTGRGSLSGTISNGNAHFSMSIPAGGFDPPYESCTADATGDAVVSSSSLTGTYLATNSCTGTVGAGQISMTRGT